MANNQGWISLHRELLQKSIWIESTAEQKVILITLMLMVNHAPNKWEWKGKEYVLQAGQVITSLDSIVQKAGKGISVQNVRTALKRFEKLGFLTNESTKQNRLITIVNYKEYQGIDTTPNKAPNSQLTINQQSANNQLTTNNNVNNDNNVNNVNKDILSNKSDKVNHQENFNRLWELYPKGRKQGKDKAFISYKKAIKEGVTDEVIEKAIENYKKQIAIQQTELQFVKQGSTWFSQKCWNDEYITESVKGGIKWDEEAYANSFRTETEPFEVTSEYSLDELPF